MTELETKLPRTKFATIIEYSVQIAFLIWIFACLALLILFLQLSKNVSESWHAVFRPATVLLISGQSPYQNQGFYSPPWALIPFIPMLIFSPFVGEIVIGVVTIFSYWYAGWKLGASPLLAALIATTPFVLYNAITVNVDWMVALSLIAPTPLSLILAAAKPQLGFALIIYHLAIGIKRRNIAKLIKDFAPLATLSILSIAIYGPWMVTQNPVDKPWNRSIWPYGIPIGLAILSAAIRGERKNLSLAASPFLTPYLAQASFGLPVLGLLPAQIETALAVIGLWIIRLITRRPI